jgi:hypothetical protein
MKEYMANDAAECFVPRIGAAFFSFDGDVFLHRQLQFLFPKNQNIQPESAIA